MSDRILDDHRRAMEEAFFAQQERELLAKLRAKDSGGGGSAHAALAEATGIKDEAALGRLAALGVAPEAAAALSLFPMAAVAWADGSLSEAERATATQAAERAGVQPGTPAFDLLKGWLDRAPTPAMKEAWKAYARALSAPLEPMQRKALADDALAKAAALADSSGGFFGFGRRISAAEQAALDEMRAALEGG